MEARVGILDRALDHALWPVLLAAPIVSVVLLLDRGVSDALATVLVVGALAGVAWMLERIRPETRGSADLPLWMEIGHFLVGVELGYGLALLGCEGLARVVRVACWPTSWPLALQISLAVVIYEGASYWQHRWFHRARRLWAFHALHHAGARLDLPRALRFHTVDIAVPTLVGYAPLVVARAPERLITILSVVISTLGILQHANIRLRTPAWLDAWICTPAVHRQHHALLRSESECNYGTTVMLWDRLFGTYRAASGPAGPAAIGLEDDDVPRTFWRQLFGPFGRMLTSAPTARLTSSRGGGSTPPTR